MKEKSLKMHMVNCSKLDSVFSSLDRCEQEGETTPNSKTVSLPSQIINTSNTCTVCQRKFSTEKYFKIHIKACMNPNQKIDIKMWNFNTRPKKKRKKPCGYCSGCLMLCGECVHCREMPRFGGTNSDKIACQKRRYLCGNIKEDKPVTSCKYCDKEFAKPLSNKDVDYKKSSKNARSHIRLCKAKNAKLSCDVCGNKFRAQRLLTSHVRRYHTKPFKCGSCDFAAGSNYQLTKHRNYKHDGIVFQCKICDKNLAYDHVYKRHMKVVHGGLTFVCDKCDYSTTTQKYLERHTENMHSGSTFDCNMCPSKLHSKKSLEIHQKYSKMCGIEKTRKQYLVEHMVKKHEK